MKPGRTLRLRGESIGELSTDELRDLAGANATNTCTCTSISTLTWCGQICHIIEDGTLTPAVGSLPTNETTCYTLLCR